MILAQTHLSIYKRKFGIKDELPNIAEVPTFGESRMYAGIQLADIVCSTLLYPMALAQFAPQKSKKQQKKNGDSVITKRFASHVKARQSNFVKWKLQSPAKLFGA